MAIKLIANYSKRLGLPGYSSHQFSVFVETELVSIDDIPGESEHVYQLLQSNVDDQILHTGFVPPVDCGMEAPAVNRSVNDATGVVGRWQCDPGWTCSGKQKDLIPKLLRRDFASGKTACFFNTGLALVALQLLKADC